MFRFTRVYIYLFQKEIFARNFINYFLELQTGKKCSVKFYFSSLGWLKRCVTYLSPALKIAFYATWYYYKFLFVTYLSKNIKADFLICISIQRWRGEVIACTPILNTPFTPYDGVINFFLAVQKQAEDGIDFFLKISYLRF